MEIIIFITVCIIVGLFILIIYDLDERIKKLERKVVELSDEIEVINAKTTVSSHHIETLSEIYFKERDKKSAKRKVLKEKC